MAKPEYAIREVSLAEVILFLLSVIILAAYHFDYRVATYIIFLDFFQLFKIIVALRQLMETKRHQKMFGSLPDAYYYKGTVKETYPDHIIVDIPEISKHCWFENDFNMDCVYPEYNFQE